MLSDPKTSKYISSAEKSVEQISQIFSPKIDNWNDYERRESNIDLLSTDDLENENKLKKAWAESINRLSNFYSNYEDISSKLTRLNYWKRRRCSIG